MNYARNNKRGNVQFLFCVPLGVQITFVCHIGLSKHTVYTISSK